MEIYLIKNTMGILWPATDQEAEKLKTWKAGTALKVTITKPRNYEFHKKYFALMGLAYEHWDPSTTAPKYKGVTPAKNFEDFRKKITIMAGFKSEIYSMDKDGGSTVRLIADSISFGNMTEEEFSALYNKTVNVILEKILTNYTGADLEAVVTELLAHHA